MLPFFGLALLLYCVWRGGNPVGVTILGMGVSVHVILMLRLLRATIGARGGHAEWVREVSTRPRARQGPAWLVGSALVLIGAAIALFSS